MSADIYLDAASRHPAAPRKLARRSSQPSTRSAIRSTSTRPAARRVRCSTRGGPSWPTAIGAQPDEIVFTSGGTESVALAIWGGVRAIRELGTRVVVGAVEHPAVGGVVQRARRATGSR